MPRTTLLRERSARSSPAVRTEYVQPHPAVAQYAILSTFARHFRTHTLTFSNLWIADGRDSHWSSFCQPVDKTGVMTKSANRSRLHSVSHARLPALPARATVPLFLA